MVKNTPNPRGTFLELPDEAPFVGRETELARLRGGLQRAKDGTGSFWLISGPVGMGKTRLVHQLADEAAMMGFRTLSGYAMKEVATPFFPFELMFRSLHETSSTVSANLPGPLGPFLVVEEDKAKTFWEKIVPLSCSHHCMIISRERPQNVRHRHSSLDASAKILQLSRSEGDDCVSPSNMDALGEKLDEHLHISRGGVVAVANLEYLVVQNSFLAVLRLLQFLREAAESTGGHVIVSFNPESLEPRERALIESEGDVFSSPGEAPSPKSPDNESMSPSQRLLHYLDLLEEAAKVSPLLLLVDDLHAADAASATAVQFLARNTRHFPVLMVGATRSEDWGEDKSSSATMNDALDNLAREGLLHRMELRGMPSKDVEMMVEVLLGGPVVAPKDNPDLLTDFLERSSGNPFFVLEMTRTLLDQGWITRQGDHWSIRRPAKVPGVEHPPLPSSLRRLISQRLLGLQKEERDWLEAAAMIGVSFDLEPLCGIFGLAMGDGEAMAKQFAGATHIIRQEDGRRWSFVQPFLKEVLMDELPAEKLRLNSKNLAEWWARYRPADVDSVARLYFLAGETAKSIQWIRRASEKALKEQNGEAIVRYSRWVLALTGPNPAEWQAHTEESVRLAEGLMMQGSGRDAERLLRELLATDPAQPLNWKIKICLADVLLDLDKPDDSQLLIEETFSEIQKQERKVSQEVLSYLEVVRADLHMSTGDPERGRDYAIHALELLGEKGDPRWRVRALDHLGWSLMPLGELDGAEKAFSEGRECSRQHNLSAFLAYHINGLGAVATRRGDLRSALKHYQDAAQLSKRIGDVVNTVVHLNSLARALSLSGNNAEAETTALEALRLSEKFDNLVHGGESLVILGLIEIERKRWEEARQHLSLAADRFTLANDEARAKSARLWLALVHAETGNPQGALKELDGLSPLGANYYRVRARLLELTGNMQGACKEMDKAWEASANMDPVRRAKIREEQSRLESVRGNIARSKELAEDARSLVSGVSPPKG
jgi:tetratricopeptide (TPR) repeat protein